jgi:hypothetical protein
MERNADPAEFDRALAGVDFPASRAGIVRAASDKGGLDNEVLFILEQLSESTFETRAELDREIDEIYQRTGGLEGGTPAAGPHGDAPDQPTRR